MRGSFLPLLRLLSFSFGFSLQLRAVLEVLGQGVFRRSRSLRFGVGVSVRQRIYLVPSSFQSLLDQGLLMDSGLGKFWSFRPVLFCPVAFLLPYRAPGVARVVCGV